MNAQEYFTEHSIDPTFAKENFGWNFSEKEIAIPIYDTDGKLMFVKTRHLDYEEKKARGDTSARKFTNPTGSAATLYCQHRVAKLKQVVLCEGEPDALRLWQEGIPAVTPTAGVKTFNTKVAAPLKDKKVFIVLDTDEAGTSSIRKYHEVLKELVQDIYIIDLPVDIKDVSDYFTAGYTKDDFNKLINIALPFEDWLDTHKPEHFKIEMVEELMAADIPADEWLVDRVLPVEGFAFIYGEEATGKTFYTLDLAHSVVTGQEWLGKYKVNKTTNVLFIDKENTRRRTQKRMKGLGFEDTKGKIHRLFYPERFELADPDSETGFSEFAEYIERYVERNDIGLIIIDSFTDVLVGDENNREAVQQFFDACRQLFRGRCVLVLHHASKPAAGVSRTSSQRARGSSNIMAQVYSAFFVEKVPKSIGEFVLEQTKSGDSEKLVPFIVRLISETDPEEAGKTIITRLDWVSEIVPEELKVQEAKGQIEEMLKEKELLREEILTQCQSNGHSKRTVDRALSEMRKDKVVGTKKSDEDSRKTVYYLRTDYENEADEDY